MIKQFDYIEKAANGTELRSPEQSLYELQLIEDSVRRVWKPIFIQPDSCPMCKGTTISDFFIKWGVPYLRCEDCGSVFAVVDDCAYKAYRQDSRLNDYHMSDCYQRETAKKRENIWGDLNDWIHFRAFRYLRKNEGLHILDVGNTYCGLREMFKQMKLCGEYRLAESPLNDSLCMSEIDDNWADVVFMLDDIQKSLNPQTDLSHVIQKLRPGGLLFFSMRSGTGIDILTLQEHANVFPYEHIQLPSRRGICWLMEHTGMEVLEYATPGYMDVGYLKMQRDTIPVTNYFMHSLLQIADETDLGEFQRFLQRAGLSSHARLVARKRWHNGED